MFLSVIQYISSAEVSMCEIRSTYFLPYVTVVNIIRYEWKLYVFTLI